jgi:DNA-directed RNA polymerase
MKCFTGWEYLLIDVANQFGLDKKLFEERIQWATDHLNELEALADQAETKPLYIKAVMAVRKAQQGIPTGHLVAFDGVCSGIQIMSALAGCIDGARATGMVDPNVRADAYTATTRAMEDILGGSVHVSRGDAKQALMTTLYGSKKTPKQIFGSTGSTWCMGTTSGSPG